jgi:hypothetical protein
MRYENKKIKRIINRMSKEGDEENPLTRVERISKRFSNKLSTGGHVERSHKSRVGRIGNKNIEQRYNVAAKVLKNVQ